MLGQNLESKGTEGSCWYICIGRICVMNHNEQGHEVLEALKEQNSGLYFPKRTQDDKRLQVNRKSSTVSLSQVSSTETSLGERNSRQDTPKQVPKRYAHKRKRLESTPNVSSEFEFSGVGKRPPAISKK